MEVWQIVCPDFTTRLILQNLLRPRERPSLYFRPPFKKNGPEAMCDVAVAPAAPEHANTIDGSTLTTLTKVAPYNLLFD